MENEGTKVEYSAETKKAGMGAISIGALGLVGELIGFLIARSQYGNVQFRGEVVIAALIFIAYGFWKHERAKIKEDESRAEKKAQ